MTFGDLDSERDRSTFYAALYTHSLPKSTLAHAFRPLPVEGALDPPSPLRPTSFPRLLICDVRSTRGSLTICSVTDCLYAVGGGVYRILIL